MATTFIRIDTTKIEGLVEDLAKLPGSEIVGAVVEALNQEVAYVYDFAARRMSSQVNLDMAYIQSHMGVRQATPSKLQASITAYGDRSLLTPLSRYPNQMILAPRKTTGHRYNNEKRPYTGGLKLPEGMRQKAVQVNVSREGGGATLLYAFFQPLMAGKVRGGNGLGIFARDRSGKKLHRYGPSVYQMFGVLIPSIGDEVADSLSEKTLNEVQKRVQQALSI